MERWFLLQAASALTGDVRPWGGKATRDLAPDPPNPPPLSNPTLSNSCNRTDVEGLSRLLQGGRAGWAGMKWRRARWTDGLPAPRMGMGSAGVVQRLDHRGILYPGPIVAAPLPFCLPRPHSI